MALGVSVGNLYPLRFVIVTLGNDLFNFFSYYPLDLFTQTIHELTSTISFLGNLSAGMSEVEQAIKYPYSTLSTLS